MTKKEFGIFINSFLLFVISFISIKIILVLFKFFIALLFDIEITLQGFTLWGISKASSNVWTYMSVFLFYSIEIFVLSGLIAMSFVMHKKALKEKGIIKFFLAWVNVAAIVQLLGLLAAGLLTKSNVFHFFNWLHIPYFVLLAFGLTIVLSAVILGIVFNTRIMMYRPYNSENPFSTYFDLVRIYGIIVVAPVVLGLLIFYLPFVSTIHKYDIIEISIFLFFFSSGVFHLERVNCKKIRSKSVTVISNKLIFSVVISYLSFLAIRFIL